MKEYQWSESTEKALKMDFEGRRGSDIARELNMKYHTVLGNLSLYRLRYFLLQRGLEVVDLIRHHYKLSKSIRDTAKFYKTKDIVISAIVYDTFKFKQAKKRILDPLGFDTRVTKCVRWKCPKCNRVSTQEQNKPKKCELC